MVWFEHLAITGLVVLVLAVVGSAIHGMLEQEAERQFELIRKKVATKPEEPKEPSRRSIII